MSSAEAHVHDWTDWVRPAVLRDSFGVVIDSAGVAIQRLTGTDQPVTPAWWRTCRTCPSEESAFPAAEMEARVQAAANQRAAEEDVRVDYLCIGHPGWPDPLSVQTEERAREWLNQYGGHNPRVRVEKRTTICTALASPAPAPRAEEGRR